MLENTEHYFPNLPCASASLWLPAIYAIYNNSENNTAYLVIIIMSLRLPLT